MANHLHKIKAVGIDLGHANVKIAYSIDKETRIASFPAHAAPLSAGKVQHFAEAIRPEGVEVTVDGIAYFVGPGALAFAKGVANKPAQDRYTRSREYQALMLGALSHVLTGAGVAPGSQAVVSCLCLGLPLTTYFTERAYLQETWSGALDVPVGNGRVEVEVLEVAVLAQPQGALLNYVTRLPAERAGEINDVRALVLDVGGGTLDYLTTSGGVVINSERSGACSHAMTACAAEVARRFGADRAQHWLTNPNVMADIDRAIRRGAAVQLLNTTIEASQYLPVVEGVVDAGIAAALTAVGEYGDIGLILCVGGGGSIYARRLETRVPAWRGAVRVEDQPMFTNVRGFHALASHKAASRTRAEGVYA